MYEPRSCSLAATILRPACAHAARMLRAVCALNARKTANCAQTRRKAEVHHNISVIFYHVGHCSAHGAEADQQVVSSLRTMLENALGPLEGDDPEEGSRPDSFLFEPDRFGHTNQHFPALLNALVAALKSIKDSVVETPAKLDAWRSAVHPVVQPYIKEGPDTCQSYTQTGNNCGVRLSTDASVLCGTCSRHKNHDWVTGGVYGLGCVTKAGWRLPALWAARGGHPALPHLRQGGARGLCDGVASGGLPIEGGAVRRGP
jgi:hypothetical protein